MLDIGQSAASQERNSGEVEQAIRSWLAVRAWTEVTGSYSCLQPAHFRRVAKGLRRRGVEWLKDLIHI